MQCIVSSCRDRNSKDASSQSFTLFGLPKRRALRERWLQELGLQNWQVTDNSAVCSNHFLSEDLYWTRNGLQKLRTGAVPVIQRPLEDAESVLPNKSPSRVEFEVINIKTEIREIVEDEGPEDEVNIAVNKHEIAENDNDLNSLHKNALLDNVKNEHGRILNDDVQQHSSADWSVSVPVVKAEVDPFTDDVKLPSSHYQSVNAEGNKDLVVNIKLEKNDEGDVSVSNNDVSDHMKDNEIGEDNSSDLSFSRESREEPGVTTRAEETEFRDQMVQRQLELEANEVETQDYDATNICSICSYEITDPRHIDCLMTYSEDRTYLCNVCNKIFKYKNKLMVHLRIHTGVKPYVCSVCNKAFRVKGKHENHMRIHSGDKPYACYLCEKRFFESSNLKYHLKTHAGDKPFSCEYCEKTFIFCSGLQRHMKIHTGDKPFTCHLCTKTFNENCNLQRHLRTHTGEKPYPCNICKKSFSESGYLQNHLKIHSGEKPFSCDVCDKRFSIKSGLQRHVIIHTGDKPFSCDICDKPFNQKSNLLKHVRVCNKKIYPHVPEVVYLEEDAD